MPKLTDLQSPLLTHAAGRDSGSLHALPDSVTADPARAMRAIAQLLRLGLLEEREVSDTALCHRVDGDLSYGAFITAAGLAAIGVEPREAAEVTPAPVLTSEPAAAAPRVTKSAAVLALLARPEGATLAELIAATGWLSHTTRAALTGLRKEGHAIERGKRDDATCYRIVKAAGA